MLAIENTDKEKIETIAHYFARIMEGLGLDLRYDSLKGTPYRCKRFELIIINIKILQKHPIRIKQNHILQGQ